MLGIFFPLCMFFLTNIYFNILLNFVDPQIYIFYSKYA